MVTVQRFFDKTGVHDIIMTRIMCNIIFHMRPEKWQIYDCVTKASCVRIHVLYMERNS